MNQSIQNILNHLNQPSLVDDYKRELGSRCDYSHLPIAPSMIPDDQTLVLLNKDVKRDYDLLVGLSNHELASIEYPFVILGNRQEVDHNSVILLEKFVYCYDIESTLSSRKVDIDPFKLLDALTDSNYDVIVWGRTHGTLSEEEKKDSSVSRLSLDYREKYNIREDEFNIRLDELDEYSMIVDTVENQDFGKEVYQITIMPTGEVAMLGSFDSQYQKFENIGVVAGDDIKTLPVDSFDPKFATQNVKNKRGK